MVSTSELPFITKTLIPKRRDHIVRRERILRPMLSRVDKKVQVVCAPAGYGKTALLTEFAAEVGPRLCWYSFSPEDRDPASFLRYCVHSVNAIDPSFGASIISFLRGDANPDQNSLVGLFTTALHSELSGRLVFAFDDVHWIDGKRDLEEGLSLLIERAPPNVHFVLASRIWPSLACLPKLAASGDLASLDVSDFRFSTDESVQLLTNLCQTAGQRSKNTSAPNARTDSAKAKRMAPMTTRIPTKDVTH